MTDKPMTVEEALAIVNDALGGSYGLTVQGDQIKGYVNDDDGGRRKSYLGAPDCDELAAAFARISKELAP